MDASQLPEEQLIRSGRMVAIGRLTPALIHELNNSLLVLLGTADLELAIACRPGARSASEWRRFATPASRFATPSRSWPPSPARRSTASSGCRWSRLGRSVAALTRRLRLQREVAFEDSYCEDALTVEGNEA